MISKTTISKVLAWTLLAVLAFWVMQVRADSGNYGQYGPGQPSHKILIDKMVGKPVTTKGGVVDPNYVDNYSSSDPRFKPEDTVFFRLKVKNTSSEKLYSVTVKDYVPSYVEPIEGPGNYNSSTRTIEFNAGDFNVNEEKTYYLKMRVVKQSSLPADKGVFCVVNKAGAYNDKASDEDTAQFCIEKQVPSTPTTPKSGPEFGLALLAGELAAVAAGIYLKKRTS